MSLYGGLEEMHSAEFQRATAAVREAEQAIDVQKTVIRSSDGNSRDALISGDRMNWTTARLQREVAEWKQQRLRQIQRERELLNDEAKKKYMASRLQSDQMKHVVDGASTQAAVEAGHRMQGALDDRFLARRRWTDVRAELRADAEIKVS